MLCGESRQGSWTAGPSASKCLTHLLDMKNENIDGFSSRVRVSGRDRLAKQRGHRRMETNLRV